MKSITQTCKREHDWIPNMTEWWKKWKGSSDGAKESEGFRVIMLENDNGLVLKFMFQTYFVDSLVCPVDKFAWIYIIQLS